MDTNFDQHGLSCDECGTRLVTDGYETFCAGCGLVGNAQVFDTPIWKTDDAGNLIGQQHGPPQGLGLGSLPGSVMSYGNRDASGRALSNVPEARTRLHRIRRVQAHGATGRQRSEGDMGRVLNEIAGRLGLPRATRDRALHLGRESKSRGRPWWLVTSATLLLASRERNSGLTPLDFARAAVHHADEKEQKRAALKIAREFRRLNTKLGVHVASRPEQFIGKLVTDLGMPREVEAKARELLRLVPPRQGGSPRVTAAGSVYVAARITGNRIGQRAVADVANVSEVSIRKVMTILAAHPQVAKELSG